MVEKYTLKRHFCLNLMLKKSCFKHTLYQIFDTKKHKIEDFHTKTNNLHYCVTWLKTLTPALPVVPMTNIRFGSKVQTIIFWIRNDNPPPLDLFQKFIRFGDGMLPSFMAKCHFHFHSCLNSILLKFWRIVASKNEQSITQGQ